MNQSMKEGQECATYMMQGVKDFAESSPDPLLWWTGFFAVMTGAMTASIGSGATHVIAEFIKKPIENLADEHEH